MGNFTTFEQRRKAPRVRGYRIFIYRERGSSCSLPTIFASGIPAQWEAIKQDATVTRARLVRSGRKFAEFTRA